MAAPNEQQPTLPEQVSVLKALRALNLRIDGGEYAWIGERLGVSDTVAEQAIAWAGFQACLGILDNDSYGSDVDRLIQDHTEDVLRWVLDGRERITRQEQAASLDVEPDQDQEQKKSTDPGEEIL